MADFGCYFYFEDPTPISDKTRALWDLLKVKAIEFNLFETELSWNDDYRRRNEIIYTRVFLLLIALSLTILIIYTASTRAIRTITVKHPSQVTFERLSSNPEYLPTLDCPPQNITIPYDAFVSIFPTYHQLCSSDFIVENSLWINGIYSNESMIQYSYDDYRRFIVQHFRLLVSLCTLAKNTINDSLSIFMSTALINIRAQSRQTIETQINMDVAQFRSSTSHTFVRMIDFIRQTAHGNGLVSSVYSNWHVLPFAIDQYYSLMESYSYGNNNCSCITDAMCTSPAAINEWIVPGFRVGCYVLESLLQSTLECLYEATCIDRLKNIYRFSNSTFLPLDSNLTSPNVTVQSLVDNLMVDRWESEVNFEYYYALCATVSCTYIINERANLFYMVTTIIGLFGGLNVVLKIIVPILVKIGRYLIMVRRQRINPTTETM